MGFINKIHGVQGLFLLLVLVLVISPKTIKNVYDTILGRLVLICIIVFFTIHNATLGLLVALIVIISSNLFLFEGIENMPTTDGTINVVTDAKDAKDDKYKNMVTKIKAIVDEDGVDKITIQDSVRSKDSKTLPISNPSSDDVAPTDTATNMSPSSV